MGEVVNGVGERYTYEEMRKLYRRHGLEKPFAGHLELQEKAGGRLLADNPAFRGGRAVGNFIEDEARMLHFTAEIRKGLTPEMAAESTKKFLFDYQNLSNFERSVMRRLFPFYTFYRKNLPLQVEMLAKEPGRQSFILKAFTQRGDPAELEKEKRLWPDYVSEGLAVRVSEDKLGNPLILWGTGLPIEELNRVFMPARGEKSQLGRAAEKTFLGMVTPLVKVFIEQSSGRDIFLDRPLEEVNRLYNVVGKVVETMPKPFQDYLEFKKDYSRKGEVQYKMDGRKLHIVRSFLLSRLYSTVGKSFDERTDIMTRILNNVTGLRLSSLDTETQILPAIRKRADERMKASGMEVTQQKRQLLFKGMAGEQ